MLNKRIVIKSVEEYISVLKEIKRDYYRDWIFVYRGERSDYGKTAWIPNVFRDDNYKKNKNYEKNIYDELYANGVVKKQSQLETAIDAQHGGFPSRLLDVTFNSLVALYFATEGSGFENQLSNPRVAVFFIEELYTPGSLTAEELFKLTISPNSYIRKNRICSYNHKLIDHMNKNERIKAQQGAFLLFQGEKSREFPKELFEVIEIDKYCVYEIQKDLKELFGLTVGKIYPEPQNQIEAVKTKMKYINSAKNSFEYEVDLAISVFSKVSRLKVAELHEITIKPEEDLSKKIEEKVDEIEEYIISFKDDLSLVIDELDKGRNESDDTLETKEENYKNFKSIFNEEVKEILDYISNSLEHLKIKNSPINEFLI